MELLLEEENRQYPLDWDAAGNLLALQRTDPRSSDDIWTLALDGELFRAHSTLMAASVTEGPTLTFGTPRALFEGETTSRGLAAHTVMTLRRTGAVSEKARNDAPVIFAHDRQVPRCRWRAEDW